MQCLAFPAQRRPVFAISGHFNCLFRGEFPIDVTVAQRGDNCRSSTGGGEFRNARDKLGEKRWRAKFAQPE